MRIMIKSHDDGVDFPLTCGRKEGALEAFGKGRPPIKDMSPSLSRRTQKTIICQEATIINRVGEPTTKVMTLSWAVMAEAWSHSDVVSQYSCACVSDC
jgi:hypothetical protein